MPEFSIYRQHLTVCPRSFLRSDIQALLFPIFPGYISKSQRRYKGETDQTCTRRPSRNPSLLNGAPQ